MVAETVEINCIVCPIGCLGKLILEGKTVTEATGFTCKRGVEYAKEEISDPKRMLTTTIKISGATLPLLPVVSNRPIPKKMIMASLGHLKKIHAVAPVKEGDVICKNILGLEVDIVASRDLNRLNDFC